MNYLENGVFYFPAENHESDINKNREAIINCANSNREEAISFSQNDVLAFSSTQQMNLSTGYLAPLHSFENGQSSAHKRKMQPFDSLITSDGAKKTSYVGKKQKKKSRCAEAHSLSERLRRRKLKEKMDVLRELIPKCDKKDKVSIVDDAITHIKMLHDQLQRWLLEPIQTTQLVDEEDK
ncbi:hypothetical protein CASFOL_022218 [Castilleja foliolosa]|uniref:BHLH domain-containing protein n=1 Tax=Castilleja foliolosa TaxID=1961234 RepID=A0ABD3CTY9_9LAMI